MLRHKPIFDFFIFNIRSPLCSVSGSVMPAGVNFVLEEQIATAKWMTLVASLDAFCGCSVGVGKALRLSVLLVLELSFAGD